MINERWIKVLGSFVARMYASLRINGKSRKNSSLRDISDHSVMKNEIDLLNMDVKTRIVSLMRNVVQHCPLQFHRNDKPSRLAIPLRDPSFQVHAGKKIKTDKTKKKDLASSILDTIGVATSTLNL